MNNDFFSKDIKTENKNDDPDRLKQFFEEQKKLIENENPKVLPLSYYSTTQLKAELRRRKSKGRLTNEKYEYIK